MASGLPDQPPPSEPEPVPPPAPEPPAETEDYLDWLENQARSRRRTVELDVLLISASVLGTAALILLIVLLVRHVRR